MLRARAYSHLWEKVMQRNKRLDEGGDCSLAAAAAPAAPAAAPAAAAAAAAAAATAAPAAAPGGAGGGAGGTLASSRPGAMGTAMGASALAVEGMGGLASDAVGADFSEFIGR